MGRRLVVVMLIAVLIAAGVFYFTRMVQQSSQPAEPMAPVTAVREAAPQPTTANNILVAAKDLPAGSLIQANMLVFRPWPAAGIDNTSHVVEGKASLTDFDGAVVRSGVRSGEPVVRANLIKRGESGFLAAVLRPGMRAVTISVSEISGVAGFVFPGDRVDMVLSHEVSLMSASGQARQHKISETVMLDLRVIAVDQRVGDQEQIPAIARGVTLEATPEQAEKIALLQRIGDLRLLLRPLSAKAEEGSDLSATPESTDASALAPTAVDDSDARTFTLDSDVSQIIAPPGGASDSGSAGGVVQLVRGKDKTNETSK